MQAIASQEPGVLERFGVTRAEADRAAWTIDPNGRRLEGAAAVNHVLVELGGPWPSIASLYRLSLVAAAEEAFYRWFGRNRSRFHRFGVTLECDEPDARCE